MKTSFAMRTAALVASLIAAVMAHAAPAAPDQSPAASSRADLPGNSVYRLPVTLTDQGGKTFDLAARRGRPMIVSMFYTSCQFVCPMLIETIQITVDKLPPDERGKVSALLVTFDPARDDVDKLRGIASQRKLDPARWTLARADAASVRKLAAALGIQYRQLPDGEINHSTVLVLLDSEGRIAGRSSKMGMADPEFISLVRGALKQ